MRLDGNELLLSATDLANHLGCRHLTNEDHRAARGDLDPPEFVDPVLEVLKERGEQHEAAYLEHLRAEGRDIVELGEGEGAADDAIAAMRGGAGVLYQPPLRLGRWRGRADFLIRVDRPSELGAFSYEVFDAKLARNTRAGTVLQLCLYSDLVAAIQGTVPERMHVVKPGFALDSFRVDDFAAYYRFVKHRLEQ